MYQDEKSHVRPIEPNLEGAPSLDSSEIDIAAGIVPEHAQSFDPAIERRVVRKIDWYLMPLMWIGYGFVYYDKVRFQGMLAAHEQRLIETTRRS